MSIIKKKKASIEKLLHKQDKDVRRYPLLADMHVPLHEEAAIRAVEEFLPDYEWDGIIIPGDLWELESISHWNQNKKLTLENKRFSEEKQAGLDMLKRIEGAISKRDKKKKHFKRIFLEGNHEGWIEKYIEYNPSMKGTVEVKESLRAMGYEVIPENKPYGISKVKLIHGWYTGKHHALKHVSTAQCNIIYGHTHDSQRFSHPCLENFHTAISLPCLCKLNKDFLNNKPTNWSHGFGILETYPGGYNVYIIDIINGRFCFNGKIYGRGKK